MYTTKAQICIRRDTAANFTSANPTLALGEIAYETDTRNIKVGDGSTAWTALGYINPYRGGTAAAPTSNTVLGSGAGAAMQAGAAENVAIGSLALDNGTTCIRNVAIGHDAGGSLTAGSSNVVVGWSAGAGMTGASNVVIGDGAMRQATTGNENVAIGQSALNFNQGGAHVAVGRRALVSNTTGSSNTAVGHLALEANQTGSNNVAVGRLALLLSTVSDLTAVGANALDANTTGTLNTAVGKDAAGAVTTGNNIVAIGHNALGSAQTTSTTVAVGVDAALGYTGGLDVVAVGHHALRDSTGGNQNTVVGSLAMFSATGGGNTALGYLAGRRGADGVIVNASCTNSVLIGSESRVNNTGQTNQIVIGQGAIGNGSNTTTIGNSSTTNTFIAGGDLRVAGGIRAVNAVNPTFDLPSGNSAAFYVPTGIGTLTDAVVVGNPNQAATLRMTHNGAGAVQCSFGRLTPSGTFDEHLRVVGTTAASAVTSVFGTAASTSTSTGALVVSGGVGVSGAIYPGDNIVMASGKGIDFSATSNSSGTMTSELLSDYEEGTWTPTYAPQTGTFTTMTMDANNAVYTKVGRQVTLMAQIRTDNVDITGASGALRISGLPFTTASTGRGAGSISQASGFTNFPNTIRVYANEAFVTLQKRAAINGGDSDMGVTDLLTGANADANYISITVTYFT